MKLIILTLLFGVLSYATSKPLESNEATDALVEIEKQRLIKFPEELEQLGGDSAIPEKNDEAKRILQEIEKINQALGYVRKQTEQTRMPTILDSSQYLFPNTGSQPFHTQNPQVVGTNGETLLLPSIRSVKLDGSRRKAGDYNLPATKKVVNKQKVSPAKNQQRPQNGQEQKISQTIHKQNASQPKNPLYFHPNRVELPSPQSAEEQRLLPTHFVIPVRLYKHNKQQYLEKHNPQEYKVKGYKIVGDIDNFYGKTKSNKTQGTKLKSTPKYHLFFLPQEIMAKTAQTDIEANSTENSSREEKLTHNRPYSQIQTQAQLSPNAINTTSTSQIVRKRVVPKPPKVVNPNSVLSASSSTVVKVQPNASTSGQNQPQKQQHQQQQQQQQQQQPPQQYKKPLTTLNKIQTQLQQQLQTPGGTLQVNQVIQPSDDDAASSNTNSNIIIRPNRPNRPLANFPNVNNNNNNDFNLNNNNNNNLIKNRPLLELQNNINNINNATSTAIKNAFQNIFRFPFRPDQKPPSTTEYTIIETNPLQQPYQHQQQQQQQLQQQLQQQHLQQPQQNYYASLPATIPNVPQVFYTSENIDNDHLDSDYKWDDESSVSTDSSDVEDHVDCTAEESHEPAEEKIFGHHHQNVHTKNQDIQKEALRQGGIIIQKLKVRKGGIAIAGPGGVATAGSGGTAIVGPGGYALTHPRSLTIAGPGTKIIAIPADVDLKDALQRTNIKTHMIPREGRIVAIGPTVYYAPATGDFVDI